MGEISFTEKDRQRFLSHIEKTEGCWIWKAAIDKQTGYGKFGIKRKVFNTHTVSWFMHGRTLTPDKPQVLHTCDNRYCVNPEHLVAGTQADNMRHMYERNRQNNIGCGSGDRHWTKRFPEKVKYGSLRYNAKLTEDSVRLIRALRREGVLLKDLAAKFGISIATTHKVVCCHAWRHVNGDSQL